MIKQRTPGHLQEIPRLCSNSNPGGLRVCARTRTRTRTRTRANDWISAGTLMRISVTGTAWHSSIPTRLGQALLGPRPRRL